MNEYNSSRDAKGKVIASVGLDLNMYLRILLKYIVAALMHYALLGDKGGEKFSKKNMKNHCIRFKEESLRKILFHKFFGEKLEGGTFAESIFIADLWSLNTSKGKEGELQRKVRNAAEKLSTTPEVLQTTNMVLGLIKQAMLVQLADPRRKLMVQVRSSETSEDIFGMPSGLDNLHPQVPRDSGVGLAGYVPQASRAVLLVQVQSQSEILP